MNKLSIDHIKGIATYIEDAELVNEKINTILYFFVEEEIDYGIKNVSAISTRITDYIVVYKYNKIDYIDREWDKIRDHDES